MSTKTVNDQGAGADPVPFRAAIGAQAAAAVLDATTASFTTALESKLVAITGTNTGDNAANSLYSGLVTNATHTGDATGSGALTVRGINGVLMSSLATGITKNTTSTGVPSIAVAADFPTLNQSTTGNAATVTTISGMLTAGANVTITGAGTTASPYSIAASGTTYSAGTGLTLSGTVFSVTAGTYAPARSIQTTSFTAAVGGRYTLYNTGGVASITDPTGTAAGQSYTVIMAAGTAQFNGAGTVFSASRFELIRSYNGSSWGTLLPLLSDTLTVGSNSWDGSILSGPQSFSSPTRPTSSGTGAPSATSLITTADGDSRYQSNVSVRDLFPNLIVSTSGVVGGTTQGNPIDGVVGGYFGTGSGNTTTIRISLCSRSLMGSFGSDRMIYSRPWSLHTRHLIHLPSNTTQYMVLGGIGDTGIPSTNGAIGFEITDSTTVRIWAYATASGRTNSSNGTISGINTTAADPNHTGEHYFWLDCNGSGTLTLFWAHRPFETAMPLKPASPICTLATGVPTTITAATAYTDNGSTGYGKCQYFMRATGTPGALFVQSGIRAAKLTEI